MGRIANGWWKSAALVGLLGVNAVLVNGLVEKFGGGGGVGGVAVAQVAGRPSDYIIVPGTVVGGNNSIIYIIDTTNGSLGALSYDSTKNQFDSMAPIDLNRIFESAAQAVPQPKTPPRGR